MLNVATVISCVLCQIVSFTLRELSQKSPQRILELHFFEKLWQPCNIKSTTEHLVVLKEIKSVMSVMMICYYLTSHSLSTQAAVQCILVTSIKLWTKHSRVAMKTDSATAWLISCLKCLQKHILLSYVCNVSRNFKSGIHPIRSTKLSEHVVCFGQASKVSCALRTHAISKLRKYMIKDRW